MTTIMTPSKKPITDRQISKAVEAYKAMLEKHRSEIGSESAQLVLGQDDYINEQVGVLRRRIEAVSDLISRTFTINRTRQPQQVLDDTGRKQYIDRGVVDSMPRGQGETGEVIFFKVGRFISDDNLGKEYELRGLVPADPYSLAQVNKSDPSFADTHPNGTHWKDADGKWCFATFRRWIGDERDVNVRRNDSDWFDRWWFAGLRK